MVFSSEEDEWDGIPCSGLLLGGPKALPVIEVRQVGCSNRRCTEPGNGKGDERYNRGSLWLCTLPAGETAKVAEHTGRRYKMSYFRAPVIRLTPSCLSLNMSVLFRSSAPHTFVVAKSGHGCHNSKANNFPGTLGPVPDEKVDDFIQRVEASR